MRDQTVAEMSEEEYDIASLLSHLPALIASEQLKDNTGIHVAVFVEPYLHYIIKGKKTVESRFSVHRIAPFKQVCKGDIILLKKSGGPIVGFCVVNKVQFYQLTPSILKEIRAKFASRLCVEDHFWTSKKEANYATLIHLGEATLFSPLRFKKKDRRGWVVVQSRTSTKVRDWF